jgi:serine/threonine protein kinase/ABC-type branched-subunit amino acid transport system substrate-binding protein
VLGLSSDAPSGVTAAWTADTPISAHTEKVDSAGGPPKPSVPPTAEFNTLFQFLNPPRGSGEVGWLATYRVIRLLGKGGMGQVFEAMDTELERPVALKIMSEQGGDESARQRFLREARATAALRNDHIVTIYRVGQEGNLPYLAMELLHGEPLDKRLLREPMLSTPEIIRIGREIAEGLAAAHERGLIHRDIKPANVWLEAGTGRVKILDFGLARAAMDSSHLTRTGMIMGTPAYMSPEQADGQVVDGRADLFSLGCILYEMATGTTPFRGETAMSVLRAIMLHEPPPVASINPAVPPALSALITRLLAKDPNERPKTAELVALTLSKIQEDPKASLSAIGLPRGGGRRTNLWSAFLLAALVILIGATYFLGRWGGNRSPAPPASGQASAATESAINPAIPAGRPAVRGVTDTMVSFGMSAPFSGPAKELGRGMKVGIDTYFEEINRQEGVAGRKLDLIALDDGYEPDRALANMIELKDRRQVFGIIGNVGTPTAEKTLPYALENRLLFFGAYTGASLLRKEPPDRYVFNFRASYGEETAAIARYLVETKKIKPEEIAAFVQEDGYGGAGFDGVAKALHKYGRDRADIVRVGHHRNQTDVGPAVETLKRHPEIRAVIMVTVYGPASRFIQQMRDQKYTGLFTNVSFVGSAALAEELSQLGKAYAEGVIVTQVVPPITSQSSIVLKYRESMSKYSSEAEPSFTSLEGYLDALLLCEGLKRARDNLNTDSLIDALESIKDLDVGTGAPLSLGPSQHQASHKVWGTVLDSAGHYRELDLE